jgi:hypothetical protein
MYCANSSVDCILPTTVKFCEICTEPVILEFPLTASPPLIEVGTFISNPLFGDIVAVAEPDLILLISPIESACILNNPLPSPR